MNTQPVKYWLFDYKLSDYILTSISSLALFLASFFIDADIALFPVKEWIFKNVLFLFLCFIGVVSIILLGISKYRFFRNDKLALDSLKEKDLIINGLNDINDNLTKENNDLKESFSFVTKDYYHTVEEIIKSAFVTILNENDRITVYRHVSSCNRFFMLGRYSSNTDYLKKGRMIYPDNLGYIGIAWRQKGDFIEKNIPCYKSNPDEYYTYIKKRSGLEKETAEKLTMKGRFIFIRKIKKQDNATPDMVIVIESMLPDRNKKVIDKIEPHFKKIRDEINKLDIYEPSTNFAENLGFNDCPF